MSLEKIANRYTAALLMLTEGQVELQDKIVNDLEAMAVIYANRAVRKVIASPIVSAELLHQIFDNLTKQLQSHDILKRFLAVLIENKRTFLIPELAVSFKQRVQASRGIVDASVTAAVSLQDREVQDIRSKLETLLAKKVNLVQQTDPAILGGFLIRIENNVLDMTLKTKLEHMTKFAVS